MSRKSSHKPPYPAFIGQDQTLLRLVARVTELNRLIDAVRHALPPEIASTCMSAILDTSRPVGNVLSIGVSSSAAAAKIKLASPVLMQKLIAAGWQVSVIIPKVQVTVRVEKSNKTKDLYLSDAAIDALGTLAKTVDDADVADALRKLLSHHRR